MLPAGLRDSAWHAALPGHLTRTRPKRLRRPRRDSLLLAGARFRLPEGASGEDSHPQEGMPGSQLSEELLHECGTYRGWRNTCFRLLPVPQRGNTGTVYDAPSPLYRGSRENDRDLG